MAGTTTTCPICGITYRIHYDYSSFGHIDERDYEDTPFELRDDIVYCRKCGLPAIATWGLSEYAKNIYEEIIKYDEKRLNECIHKGYFAEAILMIHIQITKQLGLLLLKNLPSEKGKEQKIKDFFEESKSYSIFNLAFLFNHISLSEFEQLLELNKLRNKFAHDFEERKKWDFGEMRRIIDKSKEIEIRLRNLIND